MAEARASFMSGDTRVCRGTVHRLREAGDAERQGAQRQLRGGDAEQRMRDRYFKE